MTLDQLAKLCDEATSDELLELARTYLPLLLAVARAAEDMYHDNTKWMALGVALAALKELEK